MNEMDLVEGSLKQMGENVSAVQASAVPGLAKWGQDKLDECQSKWATLSKQVNIKLFFSMLPSFNVYFFVQICVPHLSFSMSTFNITTCYIFLG